MARNSLSHVARGSEGAMFFQWRQSRRGAEKFHSAMLPHGGTGTRVWREVTELGASIDSLAPVRGTRTEADAAMIWDWHSWWAQNLQWRPSEDHDPRERADAFYEALYDRHLTVDFAHPEADLSAYPLVVVPALYLATEAAGNNLREYVENGGTLVVSYFSGIVDEHDAVHEGPCPGALRDVLGLAVEEFSPLLAGERVRITGPDGSESTGDVWTEFVVPRGAEPVWTYTDGLTAGHPAVTRHRLGAGTAWYVSTRLGAEGLDAVLGRAAEDARITPRAGLPRDVEVVRRTGESGTYLFAVNHTASDAKVPLDAHGTELLTGERAAGRLAVPAGAVRVVRLDG
jgi:beta-galactosidase